MLLGNHITGIYEKAFDSGMDWGQRSRLAKKLGFDFIEISIDESDARLARLDWPDEKVRALACTIRDNGLEPYSICLSAHRRFPFGSQDPAVRERAGEIMEKAVDFAVKLGVRVIQLAGYDVYYETSTPDSVQLFQQGMKRSADLAARKQVMLAMEIMDTPFMNSIRKYRTYEQLVNSPWFRVYPDIGNLSAWPENDPSRELRENGGSIVGIHLKDTRSVTPSFPGAFKLVPFGSGDVDFIARFRDLDSIGYQGPFMVEMWHTPGDDDEEVIGSAVRFLQAAYQAAMAGKCENRGRVS